MGSNREINETMPRKRLRDSIQALRKTSQRGEAQQRLEDALRSNSSDQGLLRLRSLILLDAGDVESASQTIARATALLSRETLPSERLATRVVDACIRHYHPGESRQTIQAALQTVRNELPVTPSCSLAGGRSKTPPPKGRHRLRIGYVSCELREHSIASFLFGVLKAHDQDQFEVFLVSIATRPDATTQNLAQAAEHWIDLKGFDNETIEERIRELQLDILIDLMWYVQDTHVLALLNKPAEICLEWLQANTTSLPHVDYFVTDSIADPLTRERPGTPMRLRLPRGFHAYSPPAVWPEADRPELTEERPIVFGCFNNASKINTQVARVWAQILTELPLARLIIKCNAAADPYILKRLKMRFVDAGIDDDRLLILRPAPVRILHIKLYERIDIALDTFPYTGVTTTCEALWMGTPVITLKGEHHTARKGASLLSSAGLPELIAQNENGYISSAVNLARDRDRLRRYHHELPAWVQQSRLGDPQSLVKAMEEAYLDIWQRHCQSKTMNPEL